MRYTVDYKDCDSESYNIVDSFTGETVQKNLSTENSPEVIERLNAQYEEAKKLADQVSRFVNGMNSKSVDNFVAAMSRDHRTLQQNFTRLVVAWIEHLAALDGPSKYDGRNEASVVLAKQIVATPEWEKRHYLPLV